MRHLSALAAGLIFGLGLAISGMVNPMKIANFLDLTGLFDPTLIFVMAGALLVTLLGYRLVLKWQKPLFAENFYLPAASLIDARLITGAALFGLGWGLSGFCPGPAVASLVFGYGQSFVFVAAMALGMVAARFFLSSRTGKEA